MICLELGMCHFNSLDKIVRLLLSKMFVPESLYSLLSITAVLESILQKDDCCLPYSHTRLYFEWKCLVWSSNLERPQQVKQPYLIEKSLGRTSLDYVPTNDVQRDFAHIHCFICGESENAQHPDRFCIKSWKCALLLSCSNIQQKKSWIISTGRLRGSLFEQSDFTTANVTDRV